MRRRSTAAASTTVRPAASSRADAGQDGVRERLGHAGVALGERAQVLHDAQRVPGGAGHHLLAVGGEPRGGGEGVDGRPGEGAEPDDRGTVGEPRGHVGVLGPHGCDHQDAGVAEAAGEVAEQVDGRGTAVLEVVDGQQHRLVQRQSAQHGGHRVVGLAALQVHVGGQRRARRDHRGQLGYERDPRGGVVAQQGGQRRSEGLRAGPAGGRRRTAGGTTSVRPGGSGHAARGRRCSWPGRRRRRGAGSCRCRPRPRPAAGGAGRARRARPRPARPAPARARDPPGADARPFSPAWPAGDSAGRAASRSTERCRSPVSRSGVVPRSSRRRAARSSYAVSAAAARPSATNARISERTACSSYGSASTLTAASRAPSAGSRVVSASASRWRARRRSESASWRTPSTQSASSSSSNAGWVPKSVSAARAAAAASTGSPAAERAPDSVVSRAASSTSTSHGPRGVSPYERPVAASRSAPRSLRVRLTRVATLAAGSAGASSGHNASTMRSSGTSAPRSVASSASKVRALRLPSSRPVSVSPPGTSTASAEASRIRVVPWPSSTPRVCANRRFVCGLPRVFLAQRLRRIAYSPRSGTKASLWSVTSRRLRRIDSSEPPPSP